MPSFTGIHFAVLASATLLFSASVTAQLAPAGAILIDASTPGIPTEPESAAPSASASPAATSTATVTTTWRPRRLFETSWARSAPAR